MKTEKTIESVLEEWQEFKLEETRNKIQKELDDHIETLNEVEEDGDGEKYEVFSHYRADLDYNDNQKDESIAELVRDADIDSTEFNIGFEQGYLRGLEVALSVVKK